MGPFCVCIVTYYPSPRVMDRLNNIKDKWSLFVYDNTPAKDGELCDISIPKERVLGDGSNRGLGVALQALLKHSEACGFDRMLYFDQDSFFSNDSLEWIAGWIECHSLDAEKYSILNFAGNGTKRNVLHAEVTNRAFVINSGCVFDVVQALKIGGHNPRYFLECVDYEFCLRVVQAGGQIGEIAGCPDLDHLVEQPIQSVVILGNKFNFRLYPRNRSVRFIFNLWNLTWIALIRGPRNYSYLFLRNSITHIVSQSRSIALNGFLRIQK